MDLKQNGVSHNLTPQIATHNGRIMNPQKISRRRCRSECLATAPTLGLQVERYNLKHNSEHYAIKSAQQSLRNSYTIKASHQMKVAEYYSNDINNKALMNGDYVGCHGVRKDNIKENDIMNGYLEKGPEIIDMRDLYLHELEMYKERLNGNLNGYRAQGYQNAYHRYNDRAMVKGDYGYFNPRNSVFDANRRRIRARSESEPHELYTTAGSSTGTGYMMQNSRSMNSNRNEDVSLKRSREASSPPLESKIINRTNSSSIYRTTVKESSLSPVKPISSNHSTTVLVSGSQINLTKSVPQVSRLKAKSPVVSVLRCKSGKLRPTTPTRRRSPLLKKSVTPPRQIIREKSVDTKKDLVQENDESASLHSLDVNAASEKEDVDSLEDDDDDLPLNGLDDDDLDGSVTDPEDNYASYLAASSKNKEPVALPKICTEDNLEIQTLPAPLAPSLFPNVPPYITFATHLEKGPNMPPVIQKILKWKLTTITPVIVRRILFNSGFRLLRKTNDWMGTWGKHMKSPCFKTLRSYQKFNHLPGSFQIGRKDRVWRNLQNQMVKHGKKEFGFMPRTFVIPTDLKTLRTVWPKYAQRNARWIIKPPASARGTGIKVVNQWAQIPKRKPLIVQRYIERPLLINGSKFDLRLYVLVTSMNPLRVYMHTDGLARFASVKYSEKADTLNDRYMHLTNYSINKLSSNYTKNEDANACQGHKWTIKSLWTYLNDQGYNVGLLWRALKNLVLRTILAGEAPINAMTKVNVQNKYNCYELFGIDVILDSELIPWLLEVNISPSLHSASPLDAHVKGPLVTALLNTVMYQVPPKIPLQQQDEIMEELGMKGPLCFDKRIYCTGLNKAERLKHSQFAIKGIQRDEYIHSILDNLTPDDIRCLMISEDELDRSSPLERIFPTQISHHYLTFTDTPRYYNRLLDAWENRYCNRRQDGIELLRSYCEKNIHLEVPPQTFQKDSNAEENGFIVEDITPESTTVESNSHQRKNLVENSSSSSKTDNSSSSSSSTSSSNQLLKTVSKDSNNTFNALVVEQQQVTVPSVTETMDHLSTIPPPPLLPLSPLPQQENRPLEMNSNNKLLMIKDDSTTSKISNSGQENDDSNFILVNQ